MAASQTNLETVKNIAVADLEDSTDRDDSTDKPFVDVVQSVIIRGLISSVASVL